jgi:hypothetical protein
MECAGQSAAPLTSSELTRTTNLHLETMARMLTIWTEVQC